MTLPRLGCLFITITVCAIQSYAGQPIIHIDKPKVNAGHLFSDQKLEHEFIIENRGNADLVIKRIDGCGGPCRSYVLQKDIIAPGKSAWMRFSIDLYTAEGAITRKQVVYSNDPETPSQNVILKADVVRRYLVEPLIVHFDAAEEGDTDNLVQVSHIGKESGSFDAVKSMSKLFYAELAPSRDNAGYAVSVRTVGVLPEGMSNGEIILYDEDGDLPDCRIRVSAYLKPALAVMPESVVFKPGKEDQLRIIFLRQNSVEPSELVSVDEDIAEVRCEISPGPGPGNYRVYVHGSGLAEVRGELGVIKLRTSSETRPVISVPVLVRGVILAD